MRELTLHQPVSILEENPSDKSCCPFLRGKKRAAVLSVDTSSSWPAQNRGAVSQLRHNLAATKDAKSKKTIWNLAATKDAKSKKTIWSNLGKW
jgi:hypothetical protein